MLGGVCALLLATSVASVASASPPAKGQYHLTAPGAGGDAPAQPGQVSAGNGGSSSTLWIIVAAAAVAAIGTGVVYARGRNEPPAER